MMYISEFRFANWPKQNYKQELTQSFIKFISKYQYSLLLKMSQKSHLSSSHLQDNCRCDYSYIRKRGPKFEAQTTNHAYYKPYQVEKQQTFEAPKPKSKHYDPDVLQTSYKMQYVKPEVSLNGDNNTLAASNALAQSYLARKSKIPFSSETEYKKNFQPKQVKVQKQPVYEYKPKQTKFEGQSSYKQQFTPKNNPDLLNSNQQFLASQKAYQQRTRPKFEGESSYKATYQNYNVKHEKQPEYKYEPKNIKFQGQSSYKANFTKLPESAYKSDIEHCPVHPSRVAIK